ncbi:DUF5949 family protein [Streptomyces sp. SKN60]|uniref:DUF5949 family protein n=1 Tax=Streptomyces TaxID=1883 RepID=UPI0022457AF2|nr:DUF5949 family protein [Streptomyces sp. SKN60]MCX2184966.1 hypothetical protein [Streptomyces sp. SKN60]
MTTSNVAAKAHSAHSMGTLTVISWTLGPTDDMPATPFLMVYSLGDGQHGPEAVEAELRTTLEDMGVQIGGIVVDAGQDRGVGAHLLVEAGRAVLTLPFMNAQCLVPPEWQAAAYETGHVIVKIPVVPWPDARPGVPVTEDGLKAFLMDDHVVRNSGLIAVPVSRIQG